VPSSQVQGVVTRHMPATTLQPGLVLKDLRNR